MKWILPDINNEDSDALEVLNRVWKVYKGFSQLHLSALTHLPDSAWAKTDKLNQSPRLRNRHINDDLIREEFNQLIIKKPALN